MDVRPAHPPSDAGAGAAGAAGRGFARRYGVAVLSSLVALAVARGLQQPLVDLAPFLLFYAAVAVSSWYGGFGPGLFVIVFGALTTDYYVFEPRGSLFVKQRIDTARLLIFLLVGVFVSWLNSQLRTAKGECEVQAEAARTSEVRARRLAEANLIAVFFSDLAGDVRDGNGEFLRLAGCTREDLREGRVNWRALTAPEHRHLDERAVDELERCRVCTPFEKEHLLRDGRRIPVLLGCAMLDDPPDECVGFVLDLTERRRVEGALREHQDRLAALASELMLTEERERRRIATVLHDSIGQTLAVARLRLGAAAEPTGAAGDPDRLTAIVELIDQAIARTRSLTSEISPPVLYEIGLEAAVRWLAGRFHEQHGINVDVRDDNQVKPFDPAARLVLFEGVRELLMNVVKHSGTRSCTVSISRRGADAEVVVRDEGKGFPTVEPGAGGGGDGFGLFNLRERVAALGGQMQIRAQAGDGTSVTLRVPLRADAGGTERTPT